MFGFWNVEEATLWKLNVVHRLEEAHMNCCFTWKGSLVLGWLEAKRWKDRCYIGNSLCRRMISRYECRSQSYKGSDYFEMIKGQGNTCQVVESCGNWQRWRIICWIWKPMAWKTRIREMLCLHCLKRGRLRAEVQQLDQICKCSVH